MTGLHLSLLVLHSKNDCDFFSLPLGASSLSPLLATPMDCCRHHNRWRDAWWNARYGRRREQITCYWQRRLTLSWRLTDSRFTRAPLLRRWNV